MTTLLSTWDGPGKVAMDAAWQARTAGANLRTTLEQGLIAAELDPEMVSIGLGALPNTDGEIELDAAMMDGSDLTSGAVCAVKGICPVISVAKLVLEKTPHVMLAGDAAKRFAMAHGMKPRSLMTARNLEVYEEWRADPNQFERQYVHTLPGDHGDTVTMLGLEDPGHVVAASSTSGLSWKMPGRVGDSPIVGAGIYADDEVGCAGATGWGEELWKAVASFRAVEAMRRGLTPQEACEEVVRQMQRRQPLSRELACVVLALGLDGSYGFATTAGEFQLWICRDGEVHMESCTELK